MNARDLGVSPGVFEQYLAGVADPTVTALLDLRANAYHSGRKMADCSAVIDSLLSKRELSPYKLGLILGRGATTVRTWLAGGGVDPLTAFVLRKLLDDDSFWRSWCDHIGYSGE